MALAMTDQRLLVLKISQVIGMGKGADVKGLADELGAGQVRCLRSGS
jgi:hypothetical protein